MTDRADVQTNCIDAYAAKTGANDKSVNPTVVSGFIQEFADKAAMSDEVVSKSDMLKLLNTRAAMGNTVKVDGVITKSMTGTGSATLTPPDSPQPLTGGNYAGYVPITELTLIAEGGELTVTNGEFIVGADGAGDYGSAQAWIDASSSLNNNNIGLIFSIERGTNLVFSQRPTGTRAFNGSDRTNISGGGFLDGLLAGDKIGLWVAMESNATLEIYDANLGIAMVCPSNLVV